MTKKLFIGIITTISYVFFVLDFHDIAFSLLALSVYISHSFAHDNIRFVLVSLRDIFTSKVECVNKGGVVNKEEQVNTSRFTEHEEIINRKK